MKNEIVQKWKYKGYTTFIVSVGGMWYCAYVILPTTSKYYKVADYDTIPIEVHGGLTFADKHCLVRNRWCIGWDYAHAGDYTAIFGDERDYVIGSFGEPCHVWGTKEISEDCESVIDQLIELEKENN